MIKIRGTLSDLDRIKAELEAYRDLVNLRTRKLAEKVASDIAWEASRLFSNAIVDVEPNGGFRNARVNVSVEQNGDVLWVIAEGEDAVFIEFGAGVYFNNKPSPHPNGNPLGLTIGSYGKGHGNRNAWAFFDGGELVITRGTPAAMPMYKSAKQVVQNIYDIAKGIFT